MKIARLITWQWGSLEDREWVLADTVLLTGESGSGKSTLLDALQTLLTAAHHHVVQFNAGQEESTQGRRGGKEPRTLAAYALGQQADGVFLRARATSYVAAVFEPSTTAGEDAQALTAIAGVEARADGGKAVAERSTFFLVRRPLSLQHLLQRSGEGLPSVAWPLRELYVQLQHQLRVEGDVVQRHDDKGSYLTRLYGALMGKGAVAEAEAFRAAKSLVKAMAYRELGNVDELVRHEILDPHDFGRDLDKMRELMRTMSGLKAEAERLQLNIERLENVQAAAQRVLDEARQFVVTTIAHAMRAVGDAEGELESVQRQIAAQQRRLAQLEDRLTALREAKLQLEQQLDLVKARLAASDIAQRKAALEDQVRTLEALFRRAWSAVQQAAAGLAQLDGQVRQLLALDLGAAGEVARPLADAIGALRPAAGAVLQAWAPMAECLQAPAQLDTGFPAYDLEGFDADLARLEHGIRGPEGSLLAAVQDALSSLDARVRALQQEKTECEAELGALQAGRAPAPPPVREALELLERELPAAHAATLAQLVEPRAGSTWMPAIEGYMGGDRFAIIVEAGLEAACTRLVKRHFRGQGRSPKVVQGSKALADSEGRTPEARAIVHELVCPHPVGRAFLVAQYGRVRKVDGEDELARTAQGLMEEGVGSRGYGMFACRTPDRELAFGEATRRRRRAWCEAERERLGAELQSLAALRQSLAFVARMFQGAAFTPLAPLMSEVLASQLQHAHAARALAALDLSGIAALEAERLRLVQAVGQMQADIDRENQQVGEVQGALRQQREREDRLQRRLPDLHHERRNATVWAARFVAGAPELATESQLLDAAQALAGNEALSLDALRHRAAASQERPGALLRELATHVATYLTAVRSDQERFVHADPPRSFDRIEALLPALTALLDAVGEQLRRQRSIGLAENLASLREAESNFNAVFTTNFCFKVRDDIRQGALTLQKLNRQLRNIRFGTDSYELQWDWVPRLQKVYDFFEAMEAVVDGLEREQGSIFDSPRLAEVHRETAQDIRRYLLASDQGASERALRELADYRHYRRYDIVRHSPVGQTRLSTWGTGSGGELETPFYVVRSAVLAHALGHFGRDRDGAPALRLMLSDEAFSKMDETRSRSVLRFLSQELGLQLIVAMPTSKSGAVKPEFDKEFTFSKVMARRDGRELFVSEAHEKTLKREALGRLWQQHTERAREAARLEHAALARADPALSAGPHPPPQGDEPR